MSAQYTYTPPVYTPLQAITADVAQKGLMSDIRSSSNASDAQMGRKPVDSVLVTYRFNKERTKANLTALAQRMRATDPVNGAQMERLFASTDVIGPVRRVMGQFGLEQNNVAHAYALYWVIYWGLANNVHDTPSAVAMQAVARQAGLGFANNADFAAMNDVGKQQAAEELMALAAIMDATSEHVKSDPALAAKAAKAALQGSKASGLELDKMILTEQGFRTIAKD